MKSEYFMGVMTPCGFETDFYSEHKNYYGIFLKGGPGTGKSTLMKKLAEKHTGERLSIYYCSSDPKSVDAVVFEDRRVFVCDATAPHESGNPLPFVTGELVELAEGLDRSVLDKHIDVIREVYEENQNCHRMVKRYLTVMGSILDMLWETGSDFADKAAVERYAAGLAREYITKDTGKSGICRNRQQMALTPQGRVLHIPDDNRVINIREDGFYVWSCIAKGIKEYAVNMGYTVNETRLVAQRVKVPALVSIEELNLTLCAQTLIPEDINSREVKTIDVNHLYNIKRMDKRAEQIREAIKLLRCLEMNIRSELMRALKVHDKLEEYYIKAIDRNWLNKKCENIEEIIRRKYY